MLSYLARQHTSQVADRVSVLEHQHPSAQRYHKAVRGVQAEPGAVAEMHHAGSSRTPHRWIRETEGKVLRHIYPKKVHNKP